MTRNIKRISYITGVFDMRNNANHDNDNCPRSENCYLLGEYGYARSAVCGALWPKQVIYWLVTKIYEVATAIPELGEKAT